MASSSPLVSIGLPTLNRYELLQRSLDSVTAQTLGNFECIIIDNYSDDNTPDVCAAMTDMELVDRVRYISSAFGTSNAEWISGGTSGEHVRSTSVLCCVTRFHRAHRSTWDNCRLANVKYSGATRLI